MNLSGVLFFPVTPFGRDGVDVGALAAHVATGLEHGPGGVFVACGTGEFHAMSLQEDAAAVRTAVETVAGRVPVLAGAGGTLPHAVDCARAAAEHGADGLLLLPPYLVGGSQEGLVAYVEAVAGASDLPVIVYQRGTARYAPATVAALSLDPRVVGFKDGTGDLDLVQRILVEVRAHGAKDFAFFNGLPTAEFSQQAFRGMGVRLYSSAAFAFVPEVATAFFGALEKEDEQLTCDLLQEFYRPLVDLRDRVPGYSVALVKAGARLRGHEVGTVRAPLQDLTEADLADLGRIIEQGLAVVGR